MTGEEPLHSTLPKGNWFPRRGKKPSLRRNHFGKFAGAFWMTGRDVEVLVAATNKVEPKAEQGRVRPTSRQAYPKDIYVDWGL